MAKKTVDVLIEKAVHALIASIEIYNKPDFKYREENFVILLINAWELALKAKIIAENNNDKRCLYIKYYPENKNGTKSKRWKYKTTSSGNYLTKYIVGCINYLQKNNHLDKKVESNLISLIEIRNSSVHFYNKSVELAKVVHELGSASIYNLVMYLDEWFKFKLNKYNLYLLPLSFLGSSISQTDLIYTDEVRLINFIKQQKRKYPFKKNNKHHYSFQINITLTKKSNGTSGLYLSNDPKAPKVYLSDDELSKRYPIRYDKLVSLCKKRYSNFKLDSNFHKIRYKLETDLKYCYTRYPGLNNTGIPIKHYSSAILNALDSIYTKKP